MFLRGEIENILVKVDNFILSTDCMISDIKKDKDILIMIGWSFLTTKRALIDMTARKLIMRVMNEKVVFNIFNPGDH